MIERHSNTDEQTSNQLSGREARLRLVDPDGRKQPRTVDNKVRKKASVACTPQQVDSALLREFHSDDETVIWSRELDSPVDLEAIIGFRPDAANNLHTIVLREFLMEAAYRDEKTITRAELLRLHERATYEIVQNSVSRSYSSRRVCSVERTAMVWDQICAAERTGLGDGASLKRLCEQIYTLSDSEALFLMKRCDTAGKFRSYSWFSTMADLIGHIFSIRTSPDPNRVVFRRADAILRKQSDCEPQRRLIAGLSEEEQSLMAYRILGFPWATIASKFSYSQSTAKRRYMRICESLVEQIDGCEDHKPRPQLLSFPEPPLESNDEIYTEEYWNELRSDSQYHARMKALDEGIVPYLQSELTVTFYRHVLPESRPKPTRSSGRNEHRVFFERCILEFVTADDSGYSVSVKLRRAIVDYSKKRAACSSPEELAELEAVIADMTTVVSVVDDYWPSLTPLNGNADLLELAWGRIVHPDTFEVDEADQGGSLQR